MPEHIDKEKVLETIKEVIREEMRNTDNIDREIGALRCLKAVKKITPEDVVRQVHGYNADGEWSSLFECSVCGWSCYDTYAGDTTEYNYCPNCGAKMDLNKERE